jgi:peptide/nickel transport system substrate-binding protein
MLVTQLLYIAGRSADRPWHNWWPGVLMEQKSRQGISSTALGRRTFLSGAATLGGYATLASIVSACGGTTGPTATGSKTLAAGVFQNPDSLDPGQTGLVSVAQMLNSMFDPLIWKFPNDPTYYPGLATSFSVSADAMTYTFKLRKGVKFHDGTPFNADAVKATFDHIVNPATKSESAIGALGPYKETVVVDPYTAQIVFTAPNAAFVNEMTGIIFGISSPTALAKYGKGYDVHPVGTGPFTFQQYVNGEKVVVSRYADYAWGPAPLGNGRPALLDQITFRILPDPSSQADALDTNEIQIGQNLNPGDVTSAVAAGKKKLTAPSTGMPYCIMINAQRPPTNDLVVRQAIEFSINNVAIINTLFKGLYTPANSLLTPTTPGYNTDEVLYHYDPAKAGQLLDSVGWKMGSNGIRSRNGQELSLSFINIADFGFDGISQLMQAQMNAVGIHSVITDQAFPAVGTTYNEGQQNLADWFYYDVDPYLFQTVFNSNNIKTGFNWEHYDNPAVDKAIAVANATTNDSARVAKYEAIALTLAQSATIIPIYNLESILVTQPNVKGIKFDLTAQPLFHVTTV